MTKLTWSVPKQYEVDDIQPHQTLHTLAAGLAYTTNKPVVVAVVVVVVVVVLVVFSHVKQHTPAAGLAYVIYTRSSGSSSTVIVVTLVVVVVVFRHVKYCLLLLVRPITEHTHMDNDHDN